MKRRMGGLAVLFLTLLWATPAKADNRVIVRTTNLQALQTACGIPPLPQVCTVVGLGDPLGQVFLVSSTTLDVNGLLNLVTGLTGFVDAEVDQLLNLVAGGTNMLPSPLPSGLLQDRTVVAYPAGTSTMVWNSYANQEAASIVRVQDAQNTFNVTGSGIVADIDTGVDPNHPALKAVLLPGYDFTRNQAGASELNDLSSTFTPPQPCPSCPPAKVNQSTAAVLDQSTAAVLDSSPYAAFGHGTMVMGIIHLVAPTAQLLPLKAFHSDGTGYLSDVLRAIYYGANNNANAINMSFEFKSSSVELQKALDYANLQKNVISAASAGNDGQAILVYPAALQNDVMGVASVGSTSSTENTRSSFSNYGSSLVWVAAPGEGIVTTYPFNTYAAGWGTSFSAPFVSGGAALFHNLQTSMNEVLAAAAVAHAQPLAAGQGLGNGRLDLCQALGAVSPGSPCAAQDYSVSASPSSQTITAGNPANYTVTATPAHGFTQTVTWNCTGAPIGATCTVSPSSVPLDGTNPATATVTLTTTARGFTPPLVVLPPTTSPMRLWLIWTACLAWLAMLLLICKLGRVSRLQRGFAAAAGLLAVSLCAYACGGGYSNGGGSGPGPGSPTLSLSSVILNPTSVNGGSSSTGTVTLSGPAPYGGAPVSLSSNMTAATVPASVTVPAGASSATFTVNTSAVTSSTSVTISASYASATKTAMLTVTPATTGTPASTYTLTIIGISGTISHSTTVQVTVN
jgi:Subtilase family